MRWNHKFLSVSVLSPKIRPHHKMLVAKIFARQPQSPQITSCLDYGSMTCKYIMTHCTKAGWRCYFKPITTFTRGSALIRKEEREEGILEATIAPMMMVMACSK